MQSIGAFWMGRVKAIRPVRAQRDLASLLLIASYSCFGNAQSSLIYIAATPPAIRCLEDRG